MTVLIWADGSRGIAFAIGSTLRVEISFRRYSTRWRRTVSALYVFGVGCVPMAVPLRGATG